ncbi:hypothetical protein LWI28_021335 [Acer negundo]|uniref:Cytochrome P450 n=1 Tax=Acer negundo TaxID=4023 RepID=A0AAD5IT53_ACENE|nr:hypothetical protein LWI28_021335 [Acer negundo]
MNSISQSASSATPVDLSEKIFALTGSIVFRMSFGQIFQGSNLDNQKFEKLVHATESIMGGFTTEECFPYVGWIIDWLNGYYAKLEKVFHELDTFFEKAIDDHLKPERMTIDQDQEDIIDVMLKLVKDQTKSDQAWLTKDNIKAVLLNIFLGGVDTSAITVVWAMAELARNPREEEVGLLVNSISQSASSGTPVDLSEKIYALTGSIVFRMAFGQIFRGSGLDNHQFEKLVRATESVMGGFTTEECIPYFGWIIDRLNGYHAKLEKTFWDLDAFFQKAIDDHLKPERAIEDQEDIIDVMLKIGKDQTKSGEAQITHDNIKAVLMNIFLGGVDTSSITEEDINMEEAIGMSLTVSKKTALNLVPVKYL